MASLVKHFDFCYTHFVRPGAPINKQLIHLGIMSKKVNIKFSVDHKKLSLKPHHNQEKTWQGDKS